MRATLSMSMDKCACVNVGVERTQAHTLLFVENFFNLYLFIYTYISYIFFNSGQQTYTYKLFQKKSSEFKQLKTKIRILVNYFNFYYIIITHFNKTNELKYIHNNKKFIVI
jgi:hypothetical protein